MNKSIKKGLSFSAALAMAATMPIFAKAANVLEYKTSVSPAEIYVSEEAQNVTASFSFTEQMEICSLGFDLEAPQGWTVANISNEEVGIDATHWSQAALDFHTSTMGNEPTTKFADITLTVPGGTQAGTYTLNVTKIAAIADLGDTEYSADDELSFIFVVKEKPAVTGYTATASASNSELTVGEDVTVNIEANKAFAASETTLTYDKTALQLKGVSGNTEVVETTSGAMILDHGEEEQNSYSVTFTALKDGNTSVTVDSAKFGTKAESETDDLKDAQINGSPVNLTIYKAVHAVTLPDYFTGDSTISHGSDYTFTAKDKEHYDYSNVTATVDGKTVSVIDNGDGTWTVKNVMGDLVITATRIGKSYPVTFETTTGASLPAEGTGRYGESYTFELPVEAGFDYSITSMKSGDQSVDYTRNGNTITIPSIPGPVVVTIDKVSNNHSVIVSGDGAGDFDGTTEYEPGTNYSFTLNKDDSYTYSVTAKVNGAAVTVSENNGTYTINSPVAGGIEITITKTLVLGEVAVSEYVKLDGTSMWLVTLNNEKQANRTYTLGGTNMYWSDKYNAYSFLVVSAAKPEYTVADFKLVNEAPKSVANDKDVNMTSFVDMNDAQLVWNIYNAEYNGFTTNVTVEKYFKADINGDKTVNVSDAGAIVAEVKAR